VGIISTDQRGVIGILETLGFIIVLALASFVIWRMLEANQTVSDSELNAVVASQSPLISKDEPTIAGYVIYDSPSFPFTFELPKNWIVEEKKVESPVTGLQRRIRTNTEDAEITKGEQERVTKGLVIDIEKYEAEYEAASDYVSAVNSASTVGEFQGGISYIETDEMIGAQFIFTYDGPPTYTTFFADENGNYRVEMQNEIYLSSSLSRQVYRDLVSTIEFR